MSCISICLFVFPTSASKALAPEQFHSLVGMLVVVLVVAGSLLAQWLAGEPVLPRSILARLARRSRPADDVEVAVPAA